MTENNFDPSKYGSIDQNIPYCTIDGHDLLMDVYYPPTGGPWPGLIFVHGGAWSEGDKQPLALIPTDAGYLVVSINYRLYPAHRFPVMIEDVKTSIRFLRAHAKSFNLDTQRIALVGHSAGGHLVALAGLVGSNAGWDQGAYSEHSSQVQAVVPMSAPSDLSGEFPEEIIFLISEIFGAEQIANASPVRHVHKDAPPFLIVHGDQDMVVPVEQAHLLYNALRQAGAPVEKLIIKNAGHGFEPVGGNVSPTLEEMFARVLAFITNTLNK